MSDAAPSDDNLPDEGTNPPPGLPATGEILGREARLPALPAWRASAYHTAAGDGFEAGPQPAAARAPRNWRRFRAAASLAGVIAISAAAATAHVRALQAASAEQAQTRALTERLDLLSARLEGVEASRSREEAATMRKLSAEIKASAASPRDVGGAVGQIAARVDRLEKDQNARLDKLGDRMEHDSSARVADVTARLDKLETKAAAPTGAPAPKPAPKAEPAISYETTGSIARTQTRLRGYWLSDIRNGYAMIDSPVGEFAVAPGDALPNGGRVLRIERRGRGWAVVTTHGQIVASDD